MSLFTETVTLLGQQVVGEDAYGNDVVDYVSEEAAAWLEQRNSRETLNANEQTVASMLLYLEQTPLLEHPDKVVWGGYTWDVAGEPGRQPGGFIVDGFQVVSITRAEG